MKVFVHMLKRKQAGNVEPRVMCTEMAVLAWIRIHQRYVEEGSKIQFRLTALN
jgi:hypothetical protein